jgi:hypothetical protein
MAEPKERVVTLKILESDREWVYDEQARIRKLGRPEPTQAELFSMMREQYAASIERQATVAGKPGKAPLIAPKANRASR